MEGDLNQVVLDALNNGEDTIEGEDIIVWADRRDARIMGMRPLEYAYQSNMTVEGEHAIVWAIENNRSMLLAGEESHPLYMAYDDPKRSSYTKNESKDAIMVVLKDLDISKLDVKAKEDLLEVMLNLYQQDHSKYRGSSEPRNNGLDALIKARYNEIVQSLMHEGEKMYSVETDIPSGRGQEFEMGGKSLLYKCDIDLAIQLMKKVCELESKTFNPYDRVDAIQYLESAGKSFNADNDKSYLGVVKSWISYIGGGSKSIKQEKKEENFVEKIGAAKSDDVKRGEKEETHSEKISKSKESDSGIQR